MKAFHDGGNDIALPIEDQWLPLAPAKDARIAEVKRDQLTTELAAAFDYAFDGTTTFTPAAMPDLAPYRIGLIVGASGTGKSSMLATIPEQSPTVWRSGESIAAHFDSAEDAMQRLLAVGLSSVPSWCRPFSALSAGEQFRANLARKLVDGAIVDEFTSAVDRHVAEAAARGVRRYVDEHNIRQIVFASCHRDIIPWLRPDWIIDTDAQAYAIKPRECLQPEPVVVEVRRVHVAMWHLFAPHHYLTPNVSTAARCFCAFVDGQPAAFCAAITFPNGNFANAWRSSRLVTLPDFQGLGVGTRLVDWVAEFHTRSGSRFYAKTTHPRLGGYRDASPDWTATSKNRIARRDSSGKSRWTISSRFSYSHKYTKEQA